MKKLQILLQTEGAYPFVKGGGVSTWAEMLCNGLAPDVDFHLYSLIGNPHLELQYELPENIYGITKVPLWGAALPMAYYEPDRTFSSIAMEEERTTHAVIKETFYPLFDEFLTYLFNPIESSPNKIGELIYKLWKYFQQFSYKKSLRDELIWNSFEQKIREYYSSNDLHPKIASYNLLEQTFGLRWLYHYLMPLDVPIPRVDISHASTAGLPALPSIIGKFEYGIPYIITDHGVWIRERIKNLTENNEIGYHSKTLLTNLSVLVSRAAYYYADLITPVTRTHHNWEIEFSANIDRIKPVINGVDAEKFKPYDISDEESYDRPTVVALANLFRLKGIKTMIRTCDAVRREIPRVQFLLFGDTTVDKEYTEKCKRLIKELKLEDHFSIEGFHNNPMDVYNKADLSILTSISEGSPYTVLESMSCECPVVATDVGGVREVLEGCGIICPAGSVEGLAEGVIRLLNDDVLRQTLGSKSRKKVKECFTSIDTIKTYLDDYRMVHDLELPFIPQRTQLKLVDL